MGGISCNARVHGIGVCTVVHRHWHPRSVRQGSLPLSEKTNDTVRKLGVLMRKVHSTSIKLELLVTSITNYILTRSFGPNRAKTCLRAYADREDPDQSVHSRSLIRIFAFLKQNHRIF